MALTLAEIRSMSDAEIVAAHDSLGTYLVEESMLRAAYVNELNRRAAVRSARSSDRLAVLTVVLSALAVVASIIALIPR